MLCIAGSFRKFSECIYFIQTVAVISLTLYLLHNSSQWHLRTFGRIHTVFGNIHRACFRIFFFVSSQTPTVMACFISGNRMRCVVSTITCHICVIRPDTSGFSKQALSYSPLSGTDNEVHIILSKSVLAVNIAAHGDGESLLTTIGPIILAVCI